MGDRHITGGVPDQQVWPVSQSCCTDLRRVGLGQLHGIGRETCVRLGGGVPAAVLRQAQERGGCRMSCSTGCTVHKLRHRSPGRGETHVLAPFAVHAMPAAFLRTPGVFLRLFYDPVPSLFRHNVCLKAEDRPSTVSVCDDC